MYNNGTVSNSTTTGYTYDEYWRGLLTEYDGEGITYDAIGNPLSYYNGKRYTFSWLYGRRLASAVVDGKTNTYTYNTEGLRLTKTIDNVVHTYYWDGNTLLMEKWGNSFLRFTYDESGAPLRVHYWNGSESIVYYYVLNLQGDVLEIRDTANNVVCRYAYDAWGKLLSIKDGSGNAITSASHIGILNPLRYRGYYYDTEEATMKKMVYTNKIDDEIIFHENNMLALYLEKIKKYMPLFEESGYSLKVGLMWKYFPRDTVILQRGSFKNGYQCYVYCVVQKDGNEVRIGSIDGEADYYPLSTAWMISSIFRKFFKLNAELYANTDDADADLNDFLSQLKYSR